MSNTPVLQDSISVLQDLNLLIQSDDQAARDAFDRNALAPFTDTLFYDWDLGKFLDSVDNSNYRLEELQPNSKTYDTDPAVVAVTGLGRIEEEDFFTGAEAESAPGSAREAVEDPASLLAPPLGYDFLNFKLPAETEAEQQQGRHHQEPRYHHHKSSPTKPSLSRPTPLDGLIPSSRCTSAPPPPPTRQATMSLSPRDSGSSSASSSPTTQNFSFNQVPAGSERSHSFSTSNSPPPPHLGTISEADAHILSIQEQARLAAEEDKRRRNTAASARFRVKKKQRDMAIEKAAKEMADRVSDLEKKISQLELENRWLRNLLVEKNTAQLEIGRRG